MNDTSSGMTYNINLFYDAQIYFKCQIRDIFKSSEEILSVTVIQKQIISSLVVYICNTFEISLDD